MAYSCLLWFAQAGHYADHVRRASEEQVKWIDGSRPDFYQDFIVPSGRLFNLFTLEDIGWTVAVVDDCFHVNCCQDLLDRYQSTIPTSPRSSQIGTATQSMTWLRSFQDRKSTRLNCSH